MKLRARFITLAILAMITLCFAQVPREMNYQGKLTDGEGVALTGDHGIIFKLYDSSTGGTLLWTEERTGASAVAITNGLFDVQLGSISPITLPFDEPYWIELEVDGEVLSPREKMSAVPYALRAVHADTADYAAGVGNAIMSVSSEADITGRTGHIMFIPHGTSEVTESASEDTIYISIGGVSGGTTTCTDPPDAPGTVYGSEEVCSNAEGIAYAVAPVAGATFYIWTVPAGADITGGLGTNSITVNFGTSGGDISVAAQNACGTSTASSKSVSLIPPPFTPGAISGSSSVCSGVAGETFSIAPVSGATSYSWTLPSGAFVTSGYGTNSIVVTFGSGSGNICVTADNSCGSSAQQCKAVTVYQSLTGVIPGAITGPTAVCSGESGVTYSVSPVVGAAYYSWTVPPGASIISGGATSSISVTFGGATTGNVCVTAHNSCGSSDPQCLAVTVSPNTVAGAVSGGTSPMCLGGTTGTMVLSGHTGSVLKWQNRLDGGGWSDVSCVTTTYSETPSMAGTWEYRAEVRSGACDPLYSTAKSIVVNDIPDTPGAITGVTSVCANQPGVAYSISPVSGATGYSWTLPSGSIITGGEGTSSITVTFGTASGNICVSADNMCGNSTPQCMAITVDYPTGTQTYNYTGTIATWTVPACVYLITVDVLGAEGGEGSATETPGLGARMKASFPVTPGETFKVLVGQEGLTHTSYGGGGGGGSFFVKYEGSSHTPYLIAGGGGGGGFSGATADGLPGNITNNGTDGNPVGGAGGTGGNGGLGGTSGTWRAAGGAGYSGDGGAPASSGATPYPTGGISFLSGGTGGSGGSSSYGSNGGFGGGGGSSVCGGGGGGFSGGGGGNGDSPYSGGGGGGSYMHSSGTSITQTAGYRSGNGQIIITW